MQRPDRRAVEPNEPPAFEHAVEDGLRQVLVVEHAPPRLQGLVGREDHRAAAPMALVDHVKQHVGGVGAIGEVADFVDDEHGGMGVERQGRRQFSRPERGREVVDERGGGREEGIKAILDGAIGDGDGQVRLPRPGRPVKMSERPSVTKSGDSAEPRTASRNVL